jgi:hypothetical protein
VGLVPEPICTSIITTIIIIIIVVVVCIFLVNDRRHGNGRSTRSKTLVVLPL